MKHDIELDQFEITYNGERRWLWAGVDMDYTGKDVTGISEILEPCLDEDEPINATWLKTYLWGLPAFQTKVRLFEEWLSEQPDFDEGAAEEKRWEAKC